WFIRIGVGSIPDKANPRRRGDAKPWANVRGGQHSRGGCQVIEGITMKFLWFVPRFLRGKGNGLRPGTGQSSRKLSAPTHLTFEVLEDRFLPSTLTYQQWRAETYSIDQMSVLNATAQSTVQPNWTLSSQLIGLDKVFANYSYRGAGYSVAI